MDVMACSACAVLVYIQGHEGRGNGLGIKLLEYALQDHYSELAREYAMRHVSAASCCAL